MTLIAHERGAVMLVAPPHARGDYAACVAPQNPIPRIEAVARDLGRLADEIEGYAGPGARKALLYWRSELLAAIDDVQRAARGDQTETAA
jgi:hypothetical protein